MPVGTIRHQRPGRARALWVLLVPAMFGFGACAKDLCKSKDLSHEQLCGCQPKDDELLARLLPTDLPYPLRRSVLRCAHDIHNTSQHNVVTKQALRDCTNADSALDAPAKESLTLVINRSNLMEQKELDDWHTQCLANLQAPAPTPGDQPNSANPATTSPSPTSGNPAPSSANPPKPVT